MPDSSKPLIVQKYGGSSVAAPEQIRSIAGQVVRLAASGSRIIVVVSAMGKTTDQLVELAYSVSPTPNRRELDMLLSTGERVSMALMSMALNDRGVRAISFTGSQAGVLTNESHSNARILDVKPSRLSTALERDHIVVLAGFQGVSPTTKEITTLGRGGSDTTAVAMAAHFKAGRCEIRKDVDGVYSADPNTIRLARHLPHLHYSALLDMTFWGAKVLHYRSVELAAVLEIPLLVGLAHGDEHGTAPHTLIDGEATMYELTRVLSVNTHNDVRFIKVRSSTLAEALTTFSEQLKAKGLPLPQFLDTSQSGGDYVFLVTAPSETLDAIAKAGLNIDPVRLSTVSATCQGAFASAVPIEMAQALSKNGIAVVKMLLSAMNVTVVVNADDRERATAILHDLEFQG